MSLLTLPSGHEAGYGDGGFPWREDNGLAVLLHGAGGDRSSWALQARALGGDGWNVLALDLPGHGRSSRLDGEVTIEALADWVGAVIDACDLPEARLCLAGHSMGACIAATLAAQRPVDRLALLGAGASMPVNDALLHDTLHEPARAAQFIAAYAHAREHHFGSSEMPGVWLLGATRAQIERTSPQVLHDDFAACNAWRSEDLLSRIDARTMVVIGGADRMTPPAAGRELAESLADATVETLRGVGHMMMLEAPTAVSSLLRRHFGDAAAR